eukprot:3594938-Rhodomonas_salina.2
MVVASDGIWQVRSADQESARARELRETAQISGGKWCDLRCSEGAVCVWEGAVGRVRLKPEPRAACVCCCDLFG